MGCSNDISNEKNGTERIEDSEEDIKLEGVKTNGKNEKQEKSEKKKKKKNKNHYFVQMP